MALELKIPGKVLTEDVSSHNAPSEYAKILGSQVLVTVDTRTSRSMGSTSIAMAEPDDIVELTWEGGIVQLFRADSLEEHFPNAVRSGENGIKIPSHKTIETLQRDVRVVALEGVKHIRLKLKEKVQEAISNTAAGFVVPSIIKTLEERRISDPGVYYLTSTGELGKAATNLTSTEEKPYLVLIHGTFSTTQGSFRELFTSADWSRLWTAYDGRIVTLEHHTVAENPAKNALQLATAFTANACVDLLSHSRGGLVGDLLCRYPFDNDAVDRFFSGVQYRHVRSDLEALDQRLQENPLQVRRFSRVAAPVAGTLLASERLDSYLNVILTLLGHLPIPGAQLLDFVNAIASAILSTRTRADQLPGIEAMMPHTQQGFVPFLNCAQPRGTDLAVIAGDVQGGSFHDRVKDFFSTLYYLEANDFVVDSRSMFRGVPRDEAYGFYYRAPKADHFSYFSQPETRSRMVDWLADGDTARLKPLNASVPYGGLSRGTTRAIPIQPDLKKLPADDKKPILFLLPGIMGTHLAHNDQRTWINLIRLAWGGLKDLTINSSNVRPNGIVELAYEPLYDVLCNHYHVLPFGFDWRLPIQDSANKLTNKIQQVRKTNPDRPIRIVAHSMGGLVARTFVASNPKLWQELKLQGGRLIMLGTPNFGSYIPAKVFTQNNDLMQTLAITDLRSSLKELTNIVRQYPGLIEMLPAEPPEERDLLQREGWEGVTKYSPKVSLLKKAREFRTWLDQNAIDPDAMVYVAGHAHRTPAALRIIDGEAKFFDTPHGDGAVPWRLGLLKDVATYYVEADHGKIPSHRPSFEGFLELLKTGKTSKLSTTPPAAKRGRADELLEQPAETDQETLRYYPDEGDIIAPFVGLWQGDADSETPIVLSVVNADIRDAQCPVIVGHYRGDPIVSVEAILDRQYDDQLSRDFLFRRYPGAIGTVRLYEGEKDQAGVLVTGLGEPGQLTRADLEVALRAVMMEYVLKKVPHAGESPSQLKVSALLIGSYGGGRITIDDSVIALSNATLDVNQDLKTQNLLERVRLSEIVIYELYRDIAIEAAHATRRLQSRRPGQFLARGSVDHRSTARLNRPASPYEVGWNRRIRVHANDAGIDYEFTTDLARNEPVSRKVQWTLVDRLLSDSTAAGTERIKTLFQYLLPYQFVNQTTNLPDLVLDLNPEAARIPWELLDLSNGEMGNREPVGVRVSILRTLSTVTRRENPLRSSERRALVIGEPVNVFPALPGALAEAEVVADLLGTRQLNVTSMLSATPHDILNAMYAADYDIIHIAAHGDFTEVLKTEITKTKVANEEIVDEKTERSGRSGVVLADGIYLGSDEFANLRAVPSIVFLNCCHLGKMEEDLGEVRLRQPGRFSASLAEHLVEMGVGVVVVAGWAVSDGPAKIFAESLYTELLNGEDLSRAVQAARAHTYDACEATDVTWGAFQIYGDPGFVLHWAGRRGRHRASVTPKFVSPVELTEYISNTGVRGRGASEKRRQELCEELRSLKHTIRSEWDENGEIWDAFGGAYLALGAYEEAIEPYEKAIATSGANLQTIEQLANVESRIGEKLSQEGKTKESEDKFKSSCKRLVALIAIAPSAERYALLGATYKRYGFISKELTEREKRFTKAKEAYVNAIQLNPPNLYYALENKIGLDLLLGIKVDQQEIEDVRQNVNARTDNWKQSTLVNANLLDFLATPRGKAHEVKAKVQEIAEDYKHVLNTSTSISAQERDSVVDQIRGFAEYAKHQTVRKSAKQVLDEIQKPQT